MSIIEKYKNWKMKRHIKKFGSKNNGYFNYFNQDWFKENQTTLIFLLNHWLLKYWFRWILRIHKDCKFDETIDKILPNTYRVSLGNNTFRNDFRTHQKFSKRIYYAFRLYWFLLHVLDFVIQRTVNPDFSFGFDTLTTYPDAHPETTTCDGYVTNAGGAEATWGDIKTRAGSGATTSEQYNYCGLINAGELDGNYTAFERSIFLFNTSTISNSATISGVLLSLFGNNKYNYLGNLGLAITSVNPSTNTNLVASDFGTFGSTLYGSKSYALYSESAYNDITIGITYLTKEGITKYGSLYYGDFTNAEPTWAQWSSSGYGCYYSDYTGTTQDPKLVVTYSLPATGNNLQMII